MSDIFYPHALADGYTTNHEAILDLGQAFESAKPASVVRYFILAKSWDAFYDFRVIVQYKNGPIGYADSEVPSDALEGARAPLLRLIVDAWVKQLSLAAVRGA